MYYAKSSPPQTIKEHTAKLKLLLQQLRAQYGSKIIMMNDRRWELLSIAVDYHDVGKADSYFQHQIQKQLADILGIIPVTPLHEEKVPHNYLSVGLIPYKQLGLSREEVLILAQVVGYHHEREQEPGELIEAIRRIVETDLRPNLEKLREHTGLSFPEGGFYLASINSLRRRIYPPFYDNSSDKNHPFWMYVMLKGLLHRLDHTASDPSQECIIEADVDKHIGEYVSTYFHKKGYIKNNLQLFAENHSDKNIITIAQTGMGKTEASLHWIEDDKAYFTLPVRVSANSIFERISGDDGIGYPAAGLLHSTSIDYLMSHDDNWEQIINQSRHLNSKLTITTIDQILKFPFFYLGFEKELATLAYSKVVIDEIQAYDPNIVAMLIKALEMVHVLGGKFMIMTATMPEIYLDILRQRGHIDEKSIAYAEFIDDTLIRHRIELKNAGITDAVNEIIVKGREAKVLVIVNTVRQAIKLYELLNTALGNAELELPLYLLHGRFVLKHRQQLEKKLLEFNREHDRAGIWITTQLVEASLDIDFDWLFTELSTLDSLFQRMGRCYRKRPLDIDEANIKIFTEGLSGVPSVYDKFLVHESLELLRPYHGQTLLETVKVNLVKQLYSYQRLKGTEFLKKLKDALDLFDNLEPYSLTKKEAQDKLRNIQQILVLPATLWSEVVPIIDEYNYSNSFRERYKLKRQIEQYTVPVWANEKYKLSCEPLSYKGLEHIYYASVDYNYCDQNCKGRGLLLDSTATDSRCV